MIIAIICAFYDEILYFIDKYNINKNKEINVVKNDDITIIIANSGVGKVNASMMTQMIIDKYNPDYIINSGCSGAISNKLTIYQTIIPTKIIYHDFSPEEIMQKYVPNKGYLFPDNSLIELIKTSFDKDILNNISFGLIATGDMYVTSNDKKNELIEMGVDSVDMESAAIAHVATKNKVSFIIIRSISDFSDGSNFDEIESSKKSAYITDLLIEKLKSNRQ